MMLRPCELVIELSELMNIEIARRLLQVGWQKESELERPSETWVIEENTYFVTKDSEADYVQVRYSSLQSSQEECLSG